VVEGDRSNQADTGHGTPALVQVRCRRCSRLAAEATPGSRLRVKCVRCGAMFEQAVERSTSSDVVASGLARLVTGSVHERREDGDSLSGAEPR
jgi:phage FluMu protein Com